MRGLLRHAEFVNHAVDGRGGSGKVVASNNHREQEPHIFALRHLHDGAELSLEETPFGQGESQAPKVAAGMRSSLFG